MYVESQLSQPDQFSRNRLRIEAQRLFDAKKAIPRNDLRDHRQTHSSSLHCAARLQSAFTRKPFAGKIPAPAKKRRARYMSDIGGPIYVTSGSALTASLNGLALETMSQLWPMEPDTRY